MYRKFFKRFFDCSISLFALLVVSPVLLIMLGIGAIVLKGNPLFVQPRPGKKDKDGNEKIFYLLKLRTMSNSRDEYGNLLPDDQRLGKYGSWIRATSADELPSLINIIKGDLSLVGPRPQLVRDMVFMTDEQRRRHIVRPGLTGLAQVNGRNNITWQRKFEYDLEYIDSGITLLGDIKIIWQTVWKVLKKSDTVREGTVSDMDFGDWLLLNGDIDKVGYENKLLEAKELLKM